MRYRVLPYKQGSKSAKALATALGGKVLKLEGSTFKLGDNDKIINWGNTTCHNHPAYYRPTVVNIADHIVNASNKRSFFLTMRNHGLEDIIPEFWTKKEEIPNDAYPVVCRTVLTGHSGAGIVIASNPEAVVPAPLYVKYVKKQEEYRIHVGLREGECYTIAAQRKARRLSVPDEEVNWQVRNLAGGFVFTREGFTVPHSCEEAAHNCLRQTGLDFGAVDVIWNDKKEKAYVLEVNTAPGLEGQTIEDYAEFFRGSV